MAPNRLIATTFMARAAVIWAVVRVVLAGIPVVVGRTRPTVALYPSAAVGVVLVTVALGFVDTRRNREWVLLGNLGVTPLSLAVLYAAPAIAAELTIGLVRVVFL